MSVRDSGRKLLVLLGGVLLSLSALAQFHFLVRGNYPGRTEHDVWGGGSLRSCVSIHA
jgi:hypothetical protein